MLSAVVVLFGVLGGIHEARAATFTAASGSPSGNWRGIKMSLSGSIVSAGQQTGGLYYSSNYGQSFAISNAPSDRMWIQVGMSSNGQKQIATAFSDKLYVKHRLRPNLGSNRQHRLLARYWHE
jgi:hypothetical protein